MIAVKCQRCGRQIEVSPAPHGQRLPCPQCGQSILVPADFTATPSDAGPSRSHDTNLEDEAVLSDEAIRECLAPSQGPGELGRLGPYRVLRVLGAGGMGVVFEAEDPHLRRPVALKVLKPELAHREASRLRFLREAQAAASLDHPHIVTIFQVGEDRGVPYLAMPLLKGETLASRLRRDGRLPVAELVRVGKQVASGLAAAHEHGLIHRDIKPDNVFLVPDDGTTTGVFETPGSTVKIVDFGLARPVSNNLHLTRAGAVLGTPAFMAPEQARGEEIDPRADLFSLGCVLYRSATGVMPFPGNDPLTLFAALKTHKPKPPRELNDELPPALSDLIERLLAKERDERPESARVVMLELDRIERSLLGTLGGTHEWPAPARGSRHWLVATGMIALVLGIIGILELNVPHEEEPLEPFKSALTKEDAHELPTLEKEKAKEKDTAKHTVEPQPPVAEIKPGLDGLDARRIPAVHHYKDQPRELVGVFQEERLADITALAFSPQGRCLATGGPDGVGLWEFDPRPRQWGTIPMRNVDFLAYTADGLLAVGTRAGDLKFWSNAGDHRQSGPSGEFEPTLEMTFRDRAGLVALSPDGKLFAVNTGKMTRCFRIVGRRHEERLPAFPTGEVSGLAFSGDGTVLGCSVPRLGVSFYDLSISGPRRIRLPEIRFNTKALAFAPNSPLVAAVTDESATVRLYDYAAALPRMIVQLSAPDLKTHAAVLRFSPDGGRLALKFQQGPLILWDDVNQLRKLIDHRKQLSLPATTTALAFTADGRYLAAGGQKGLFYLLRLDEPVIAPDSPASAR